MVHTEDSEILSREVKEQHNRGKKGDTRSEEKGGR